MFTKKQIQEYIALNAKDDNFKKSSEFSASTSLKHKLVEAKVLVDRWNIVSTDIVFHSSLKEFVRDNLGDTLRRSLVVDYIWGATIHYSDDIPKDKGMILALDNDMWNVRGETLPCFLCD